MQVLNNIAYRAKNKIDNYLFSGFTVRKIKIEWKKQESREVKINYVDTENINYKNIIWLDEKFNTTIYNYKPTYNTTNGKSEKYLNPFKLGFYAMLTPNTKFPTIHSVQNYWKVSYRQARYIREMSRNIKSQKDFYNLYLNWIIENEKTLWS